jgi:Flp pilus assembly protein TadG
MKTKVGTMRRKSARIVSGEQGQTLLMFVLFVIVLIVFIGLGVDLGFAYITRARLSKAVDSACLTGIRNLLDGQAAATDAALAAFSANYGTSGRDVAPPVVTVKFSTVNKNTVIDVKATDSINTYFIRVLPSWKTLAVGSFAEATRANVIMGLVLDRSGSMGCGPPCGSGGGAALPTAVASFINHFDDTLDKAAMSSFASCASLDIPMEQPFKSDVTAAAPGTPQDNGRTFSEGGLMLGFNQVNATVPSAGEIVIKVVIFFTDGFANVFQTNFACRVASINLGQDDPPFGGSTSCCGTWNTEFMDPATACASGTDPTCSDTTFPSLDPLQPIKTIASNNQNVWTEGQLHALSVAKQIRLANILVYSIGLGSGLNQDFLKNIANDPTGSAYDNTQISGEADFAPDASQLKAVFDTIANKILLRLSK